MRHTSVCFKAAALILWFAAISTPAGAQMWTQTDWSGGPGQLSWFDSTMYYTGMHEDGWRSPGDLGLVIPDDSNWTNTGDLISATCVYSLIETSDGALCAATADSGRVYKSFDAGTTWVWTGTLLGATHVYTVIEASDGALYAGTSPLGEVFKSVDAGTTWANTGDLPGANDAICLLEASDGALYAGTGWSGEVYKSVDAGTTWVNTGNLVGATYTYTLIEASDGALYAGTGWNGDVFRSVDAGTTWVWTGDLAGATDVWPLMEASDGALYAATYPNGNVFKSVDAGTTWINTGDLAGADDVTSLLETADGALYAGTSPNGDVFKSLDAGSTWVNTGDLAGATEVRSLIEVPDRAIYAGTYPAGDIFKAGYSLSGELVSSVYGVENKSVGYGAMTWNETLNGQTVLMKVRTDTLPDMLTAPDWGSCPSVVNGEDISGLASVSDGDLYVQYRAELSTARNDVTPQLHDIGIEYTIDLEGPVPDPAVASDGTNPVPGIDDDDYVTVTFDQPTNRPVIAPLDINSVLALSGGHSWLDGFGGLDTIYWNPLGTILMIELSVRVSPPTVAVGDTITPDGATITDEWGNPAVSPVVITGSFSPPGAEEMARFRLPRAFSLSQNQPNPFIRSTAIRYVVPVRGHVNLAIYDLSGRFVETIVDENQSPGVYEMRWEPGSVACGIYFCRLQVSAEGNLSADEFTDMKKMIVLR